MSEERPIAVIADVHGNRWALEAVLADIERQGVGSVVNLGDSLYGPLDAAGTARLLMGMELLSIRGNQDRVLLDPPESVTSAPTFRFVSESLGDDMLGWLERQEPSAVVGGRIRLCHGTPDRDDVYLAEAVTVCGVGLRAPADLVRASAGVREEVILCGHSHVPRTLLLPDGKLIVNPGSVGLPAYTEDSPLPHAMEAGTPHARYAVLSHAGAGWTVEQVAVPYDWERAARVARENGRPDWAEWIRSGRAAVWRGGRGERRR